VIAQLAWQEPAAWATLLGGLVLSFLYSGLETGTYAVNKVRLDLRAESGDRRAVALRSLLRHPSRSLIVLLIGNNLANDLASGGMVLMLTLHGLGQWSAQWYAVAVLTPVVFIFCELLPKNLFYRHAETLTYLFSGFLGFCRRVFTLVGLVHLTRALLWVTLKLARRGEGEVSDPLGAGRRVSAILDEGRASGALTDSQSLIAERVVRIGHVRLRDVMVPLKAAVLVPETITREGVRELLGAHKHPRLGVYRGGRDNIVGLLNAYDVLLDESGRPPAAHVRPVVSLPEGMGVTEALVELQRRREVIAFVCSERGAFVGLVTMKDLVEEIVGELHEW